MDARDGEDSVRDGGLASSARPRRSRYAVALLAAGPREAGLVLPRLVRLRPLAGRFEVAIVVGPAARGLVVADGRRDPGVVRIVEAGREGVLRAALADAARRGHQGTIALDVGRGHDPATVPQLALRLDQGFDVVRAAYPPSARRYWPWPWPLGRRASALPVGYAAFARRVTTDPTWADGPDDPDDLDLWAAAIRRGYRATEVMLSPPGASGPPDAPRHRPSGGHVRQSPAYARDPAHRPRPEIDPRRT